ncbi:unnamed protein product [Oppiella nova]|uniref:Protein kinase domain-containing protein n=1 Tax=Oppiella nova TaxID=334625 RepID=A0A7R9MKI7_9ACAR|nr:unnamed protein product [Oppiella nova]CAG2178940.1 unnamed protein product [Oppiella nova]
MVVADFGSHTIRKSTSNVSNPTHEAPEVRGGESNGPKSDVYSLAITTEEIFSFNVDDLLESSHRNMLNYENPTVRPSCSQCAR